MTTTTGDGGPTVLQHQREDAAPSDLTRIIPLLQRISTDLAAARRHLESIDKRIGNDAAAHAALDGIEGDDRDNTEHPGHQSPYP